MPPPQEPPGPHFRIASLRPLAIRDFALLWTGMTISLLGDGIYLVAIVWQVLALSNTPTALSIALLAWTLPQILFLLIGGVASDRFDRRRVLIGADLLRAAAITTMGALSIAGTLELWHLWVAVALYGIGDSFFLPAFSAIVPDVVPKDMLLEANSLDQVVRPLVLRLAGPALGGFLVALWGPGEAFLLDGVSFAVSAVCVVMMRPHPLHNKESGAPSALQEIAEGLRFVRAHTWLWATLLAAGLGLLFYFGPFYVLVPFVVRGRLGGGAEAFGLVLAAGGVGAIVASLAMGQRGLPRRFMSFVYVTWALGTLAMAYFAVIETVWQAMVISAFMAAMFSAGLVVWGTLMQSLVPGELLGRVSSLDWLASTSLIPVSFAITGPIGEAIGVNVTLSGAAAVGGVLVLAFLLIPGLREVERAEEASGALPDPVRR